MTEASAAQILLRLSLDLEGMNASDGFAWAEQHLDHLYRAFGKTIDVHPAELRLQLLPSSLGRRLGQTTLAFDVRLTLLLEANVSTLSLQEAMQDLAYLADVTGISHFEDALQKELESAGSASTVTRVILGTLGSAEVIENYFLPEPFWIVGPWDTAACAAACGEASEIAEVTCSRGSWLLCSGPAELLAGPQPSSERPCSSCPATTASIPGWVLLAALGVGLCCCTIMGFCLAKRCLKSMSRALPQQGYTGQQNLGDVGTQAYHVEPGLRTAKSRKSASSGGDGEGFLQRLRTMKTMKSTTTAKSSRSRKTAKSDEEVKSAKTKVVWDLDMEEIKTSFAYGQSRAEGRGPRNTFEIECDVDLEDPVALEPSWDEEQQRRQPSDKRPWSPSSSLSRPSRQRSGTLLDGPESPMHKADTELTIMRSSL